MTEKRILLVDGDIVIYKAAFAVESVHDFSDGDSGQWVTTANLDDAKAKFNDIIAAVARKVAVDAVAIALTHSENWRKEVLPTYKQPRSKVRRPILLKPMKEWVLAEFKAYVRDTLEADDVLGILATWDGMPGTKIIASIDKDLLQIPGRHINIDTFEKTMVNDAVGSRLHMTQTLTGDQVDNYPGCSGVGKKTAEAVLSAAPQTPEGWWEAVVKTYAKKGLTEEDALVQARVARICRAEDYDFKERKVRLWTPPVISKDESTT